MSDKAKNIIIYSTLIVVCVCVFFWGIVQARSFLAPVTLAVLLAMLVLPLCKWLEKKGMKRGWASLLSDLAILIFCVGLMGVLALQVKSFATDWPEIKERVIPQVERLQQQVAAKTGLTVKEQNERTGLGFLTNGEAQMGASAEGESARTQQQENGKGSSMENGPPDQDEGNSAADSMVSTAGSVLMSVFGFFGTFLLVFIYIFFFLLYRHKFSTAILKVVPEARKSEAREVISNSAAVSQNYLVGRLILILCLAVLYAIGLSISGVKHAILISVLAAFLSLLPYIGNAIGFVLAFGMAFFSGADTMGIVGVVITFGVAQFVESYVLEPYVVGDKVDLNPIMVILVVVLGEAVWGLTGMVIAIPVLGIVKVVCDHVPVLSPIGYVLGQKDGDDTHDE